MARKMTSTSFNVGLGEEPRLSSRVLRPPGGGHTDIFGGEPEPLVTGRRQLANINNVSEIGKPLNGSEAPAPSAPAANGHEKASTEAPPAETKVDPKPEPKVDSQPKTESKPEPAKAEPPKRVRVPPGGFSSGLW